MGTIWKKFGEAWRSPYPQLIPSWRVIIISSVIVFFILYLLRPFGLSQLADGHFVLALYSTLVSAVAVALFVHVLPRLFPRYYETWTVGRYVFELLALFLLIAVGIWLVQSGWTGIWMDTTLFCYSLFWVLVIAPFPTIFFVMLNRNLMLKRNLREAVEMNRHLPGEEEGEKRRAEDGIIRFVRSTKESLEVKSSDFLYAEAEGNYVALYYLTEAKEAVGADKAATATGGMNVRRKLLRITMKQTEESVTGFRSVLRCHRAFLVNIDRVVRVEGNSQGYRLRLEGCDGMEVPVSRAYASVLKQRIFDSSR